MISQAKEKVMAQIFKLTWLAYFAAYIGRLNFTSIMGDLIKNNYLTFSETGVISMLYFITYGFGQVINGILGDKLNPKYMVLGGLLLSGISNFLMPFFSSLSGLIVIWGLNGYFQSMIWPPIIRIYSEYFSMKHKNNASVDIVSSMVLGSFIAYCIAAISLKFLNWKWVFYFSFIIMSLVSLIWFFYFDKLTLNLDSIYEKNNSKSNSNKELKRFIINSGLLSLLIPVTVHGFIKDGIVSWIPTYIAERFYVSSSFSIVVTMMIPLLNLSGAYMAKYINKKNPNKEVKSSGYFFFLSTVSLILLMTVGLNSIYFTGFLFAIITASMLAINTLLVNILPSHFASQHRVATVSGLFNAISHFGSAIAALSIGIIVEFFGWPITVFSWVLVALLSFVLCIIKRELDYSKPNGR
jgi:OPA family glycerol-3-phosphate transporter-like MFS transporter